jgi:hypothetical protein
MLRWLVRRSTWGWLVLILLLGVGVALVALTQAMSGEAVTYGSAVECSNASSPSCFQLSPGVIRSVKVTQTTSGEEDHVVVETRGTTIDTALLPSATQATKVKAGAAVTVKWYVGNLVAVVINGDSIRSTESPLNSGAGIAYFGWMLIWLAAALGVVVLVERRLVRSQAAVRQSLAAAPSIGLAGSEGIMPGGEVGWRIQPKMREALLLPIAIGVLAVISLTPFFNPQRRSIAVAGDAVLVVAICIRFALTTRNTRVFADRSSLMKADWLGRVRTWPLHEVALGDMFSVRTLYSNNACIAFIGHDGSMLFLVSSFYWDLNQIASLCMTVGIPLVGSYDDVRILMSVRKQVAFALGSLVLAALAGAYFFPATGGQ